ncbi:arsenate reductase (glutaredoxin) [Phaeobacter sp. QD34_3]|uniref:arsenate reductase (glutaredoxin) n=1 Tax=unclassified Phaeobacter TaxID=2621772 RepID=UPI00237F37A7|nr:MULTISPECIES: arsenate reductase (glutaredoxin) [unclassified Phaeobacter]MDE4131544.1 arsenate reductase (glutaredoxin) [Phaeobacter sp. QD34_3]MDE4135367.1 arsenate reductase (glutaredoxin) [Phaeobacter sp. QD34_24]
MITYWHNPRCSKSRAGLALLEERGAEVQVRLYLKDAPNFDEIKAVHAALGVPVIDMMRRGEKTFKELGLTKDSSAPVLFAAMADHPILIERPIAIKDTRAVIGRPTEAIETLL